MKLMKKQKGAFEFGDVFMIGIFVLMMIIMMFLYNPLMDVLVENTSEYAMSGLLLALMHLLPIVAVGFFIWSLSNKIRQPRF